MRYNSRPLDIASLQLVDIARLWRAFSDHPIAHVRNQTFWGCVTALQERGFTGNARRLLERVAPWSSHA